MAQADIIKEYLVNLGFQVDERGLKNFTNGIDAAGKNVLKLVAGIQGVALAITAGVTKFASGMEKMYFASQKGGASATNIKALHNAVQNLTGAGEEAEASLQALAQRLRDNPGTEGFLNAIGVQTREASGELRDMADIMLDFGQAMKDRPYYLSMDYARDMGISEDTLRALIDPRIAHEMAKQQEILKKAGYDKAAKDASDYMQKLRELVTQIEVLVSIINGKLIKTLGPHMERAVEWFSRNGDTVAKVVGSVADSIIAMAAIIMPILDTVAQGWKNIYDWVTHLGRAINNILPTNWSDNLGAGTAWLLDKLGVKGAVDGMLGITPGGKAAPNSKSQSQSGALDPMRFFMGMGWTKEQAAGIVANLQHESALDHTRVQNGATIGDLKRGSNMGYGLAQWDAERRKNFEKWAGKSIYDSTAEEQMRFVHYELTQGAERRAGDMLRAANNARQAGEIVSRHYERPAAADAEALKRGATAVQIAQKTEININGGDAMSTGRAVAAEQERVNAQLARNLQTAVR